MEHLKIEYLPVMSLEEYANNTRKHTDKDVEQIMHSIERFGFSDPIGIWSDHNIVVEGHGRLMAAKHLGMTEVPCIRLDHMTDEQRRAYGIMHNKTAELSKWDFDMLQLELDDIDLSDFDVSFDADLSVDIERKKSDLFFKDKNKFDDEREEDEEYNAFLDKFKEKHTTDDCYTPDNIYEAVADYVADKYNKNKSNFVRPFYPGGDYTKYKYEECSVVVDNPPFSILSSIVDFYIEKNIPFFLFCPALTALGILNRDVTVICTGVNITYENGANVNTSFVTNMDSVSAKSEPELYKKIDEINRKNSKKNELPKYQYPENVLTAAMLNNLSKNEQCLSVKRDSCYFLRQLDSQKETGNTIFGSGLLLSTKAAAEKAAAEAAAEIAAAERAAERAAAAAAAAAAATVWPLSDRELDIIKKLDEEEKDNG